MLSLAAVIPVSGWAARRFGAKRVYLLSLILFTLGSALCGLATSTTELIVFRVLQGIGGGMIMPVGQMMMAAGRRPEADGTGDEHRLRCRRCSRRSSGPTIGGAILQNAQLALDLLRERADRRDRAIAAAIRILPTGGARRRPTGSTSSASC